SWKGRFCLRSLMNRRWYKSYPAEVKRDLEIPEITIYSLLQKASEQYGERIAIIHGDSKITYKELRDKIDRLAATWKEIGLEKGKRIGLMVSNDPFYIISYYAAMKLGLICVQINPRYTPRELLEIVNDSTQKCIIVEEERINTIKKIDGKNKIENNSKKKYIIVEEESINNINKIEVLYQFDHIFVTYSNNEKYQSIEELLKSTITFNEETEIDVKNDTAVIQYTGGTTGTIKGAKLTHFNLVANVYQSHAMYGNAMRFGKEMILTATPLYHVYVMTSGMNLGIYLGATILLIKKFDVKQVLEFIKQYQPTFFPGVPRMYNAIVNHKYIDKYGLDSLKFCSCGSAPLPLEVIRKFEKITGTVIGEGFGLSEASPSTHRNPYNGTRKIGSIGIPFPNTDCKIMGEDNVELPVGTIGELVIKGPQVMKGYWENE